MDIHQKQLLLTINAPGKVIVCGQHAVVYGHDALAMAINLRCQCKIYLRQQLNEQSFLTINLKNHKKVYEITSKYLDIYKQTNTYEQFVQKVNEDIEHIKLLYKTYFYFKGNIPPNIKPYLLQIQSQIPIGKCLGSSAAFNVVLATSFLQLYGYQNWKSVNSQLNSPIYDLSLKFEVVEHGTPSGIDNYVATYGGLIRCLGNKKQDKFTQLDKSISKQFLNNFQVILVDSQIEKDTKKAVTLVKQKCTEGSPEQQNKYKSYINKIGQFTDQILQNIKQQKCKNNILSIIQENHRLLRQFGISTPVIEQIVQKYTKNNEMSAKITGAGMGGFVLVIALKQIDIHGNNLLKTELSQNGIFIAYNKK